ncbi:MAG: GTPase domain-containing protein [Oligoflexales bacterium]|nr:GTPase domain-containing protein [Oligoflexales bacterium]
MFELQEVDYHHYFEFLPLSLGYVRDYHLKMHLYTLPDTSLYETLTPTILKGIDGYVFVSDARIEAMAENIDSYKEVKRLLASEGYHVGSLPRVIQYNKMDLDSLVPINILRQELNPGKMPDCEAIAKESKGTFETLLMITKLVLDQLTTSV